MAGGVGVVVLRMPSALPLSLLTRLVAACCCFSYCCCSLPTSWGSQFTFNGAIADQCDAISRNSPQQEVYISGRRLCIGLTSPGFAIFSFSCAVNSSSNIFMARFSELRRVQVPFVASVCSQAEHLRKVGFRFSPACTIHAVLLVE